MPISARDYSPRKRRRRRRWVWRGLLLLLVFVVGWYAVGRATDAGRRVRVIAPGTGPGAGAPGLAEGEPLVVAAYNIAHGRGLAGTNWAGDRDARLTEIAALIASWDADVVVLNEVDLDASWSGRKNQARILAERAGYPYRAEQCNYDLSLPGFRIRFGNAVLSRLPITDAQPIDYPAISGLESAAFGKKRGVVCTIDLGRGKSVRVVAVHWDTRDAPVRSGSADALIALAQDGGPPIIAAGDFNSTLLDAATVPTAIRRLVDGSTLAWFAPGNTPALGSTQGAEPAGGAEGTPPAPPLSFRSDGPTRLIDYVLAQPPWRVVGFEAVDSELSDHRPVVAVLEWVGEE